jgi:hypothetical protein
VHVNGVETNVATCGTVTQNSDEDPGYAPPAIDGSTNGVWPNIAHTGNANPWWQVQLASEAEIAKVVIWNRTDGAYTGRGTDAVVALRDSSENVIAWL